jgi:hypothetical protein
MLQPWGIEAERWARAEGTSVERLCVELEISRARLSMLTKEYCGLSAQELVDGFRIRRVKRGIIERLREAAEKLWGMPGMLASWKYEGFTFSTQRHEDSKTRREQTGGTAIWQNAGRATKQSRYFRMRPEEYAGEERYEERARRVEELVVALRRGFDLEDWAARVGFVNGARLKRACLNVVGRSLRAIERAFAEEVVRYYLCAEDKVLREMACRDEEHNPRVIRARWVYAKTETAPREPFLDEWSKAEELAGEWLEEMRRAFGGVT